MNKNIVILLALIVHIAFTTTVCAQKIDDNKGTVYKNALVRMEDIDGNKTELLPVNNVEIHYISDSKLYLVKTKVHHASMIVVEYQKR